MFNKHSCFFVKVGNYLPKMLVMDLVNGQCFYEFHCQSRNVYHLNTGISMNVPSVYETVHTRLGDQSYYFTCKLNYKPNMIKLYCPCKFIGPFG